MTPNPYASALGALDARSVLAQTPELLLARYGSLTPAEIDAQPAPGKWSPREVLCHIADCELAFGFRLRQMYAGVPAIQPFDQDHWARAYASYTGVQAMETFRALRIWNLAFIDNLTAEDRKLTSIHPERGSLTLQTALETIAGHDRHHLALMGLA